MKFIYSETINAFRKRQYERMLTFHEEYKKVNPHIVYKTGKPILLIGATDGKVLGEYHTGTGLITLSEKLITIKQPVIDEVIKHELAHFYAHALYGMNIKPHGEEFKKVCKQLGTDPVAKMNLKESNEEIQMTAKHEGLLAKVEKLFALGKSSNENEAELAIQKANDLIQKYNLQYVKGSDDAYVMTVAYVGKKIPHKVALISKLLKKLFGVYALSGYGYYKNNKGHTEYMRTLEISGRKEKVEVAAYVFDFLDKELERFYKTARKKYGLSGLAQKNNYFDGLIDTFISRSIQQNANSMTAEEKALMRRDYENECEEIKNIVYPDANITRVSSSRRKYSETANRAGNSDSSKLSIRSGVNSGGAPKLLA